MEWKSLHCIKTNGMDCFCLLSISVMSLNVVARKLIDIIYLCDNYSKQRLWLRKRRIHVSPYTMIQQFTAG